MMEPVGRVPEDYIESVQGILLGHVQFIKEGLFTYIVIENAGYLNMASGPLMIKYG